MSGTVSGRGPCPVKRHLGRVSTDRPDPDPPSTSHSTRCPQPRIEPHRAGNTRHRLGKFACPLGPHHAPAATAPPARHATNRGRGSKDAAGVGQERKGGHRIAAAAALAHRCCRRGRGLRRRRGDCDQPGFDQRFDRGDAVTDSAIRPAAGQCVPRSPGRRRGQWVVSGGQRHRSGRSAPDGGKHRGTGDITRPSFGHLHPPGQFDRGLDQGDGRGRHGGSRIVRSASCHLPAVSAAGLESGTTGRTRAALHRRTEPVLDADRPARWRP